MTYLPREESQSDLVAVNINHLTSKQSKHLKVGIICEDIYIEDRLKRTITLRELYCICKSYEMHIMVVMYKDRQSTMNNIYLIRTIADKYNNMIRHN